jgi:alpha-beta hydrolase superfamily lysophospholipase
MLEPDFIEGFFPVRGGLKLRYLYFNHPEASDTLVMLHGHGEHCGRYRKFAKYLGDKKLNLAVFDARGHGLSDGVHVYVDSYEDYIQDAASFVDYLTQRHGLQPKFYLLGHSNGGLVAVHWAMRNPERLKALFLSSPFLGLRLPGFLISFNAFLSRVKPAFIYKNPVYPPYLTHNLEEVAAYKKDTLIRRQISARLLHEMMTYQKRLAAMPALEFPFPVYIMMAGLEKVVNPAITRSFYERLKAPAKELKVFPGFYHEIFNELGQEQVFDSLRGFIDAARAQSSK